MGAYTSVVRNEGSPSQTAAVAPSSSAPRRRRSATGDEQARRVAWGKKWGALMAEHAQTYKRKG